MVEKIPISEYVFSSQSVSAVAGSICSSSTNYPLNGFLQRVSWMSNVPGSLFLLESGTNIVLGTSVVISGTNGQEFYPRTPLVSSAGLLIGGSLVSPRVINNNLLLIGSSFTSGTTNSFGPVIINYW